MDTSMRLWFTTYGGKNTSPSSKVKAKAKFKANARLVLERFEDRCLPSGATLTVNTLADLTDQTALSLREAVAISQGGAFGGAESSQISGNPAGGNDTIVFNPGLSGTITLTLGELNGAAALSQNVTIVGPGASLLAVQGVGTQIFNNGTAGVNLTIAGLTIEDGFNGGPGGAILNNGSLVLTNDVFTNNKSTIGGGGAIADVAAGGTLSVTGTTFNDNSATGSGGGGAIFSPGAGISQTFTNCTFTNNTEADAGAGGGAIFSSGAGSPLTIANGSFSNDVALGTGGAIDSDGASQIILTGSTFTGNSALNGGAVAAIGSGAQTIDVADTTFSGNSAIGGTEGGGALDIQGNTSTVTIGGSSFSQNLSDSIGGAISSGLNTGASGTGVTIDDSTFSGNKALAVAGAVEGGAFFDANSPKLAITNSNFLGNSAISSTTGQGGALYLDVSGASATPATIANDIISGNTATSAGGGVFATGGTISTFSFSQISNNTSSDGGGLDIAASSVVTLSQSTVSGNSASIDGGGVYNTATFDLNRSTVSGNTAAVGNGGGIFSDSPLATNLTVINSTVTGNGATIGAGGGIYSNDTGAVLVNSTIALNQAAGGGGGFYEATAGGATLTNTIVALNTQAGAASDIGGANVVSTSGENLIGAGGSGGLANTNGNQIGVSNPGLDPNGLQNNGGPTQTIALTSGSPAINNGTNSVLASPDYLTTDQRGYSRLAGAYVDIGAYEFGATGSSPAAPTALMATAGNTTAALAWIAPTGTPAAATYKVYYSVNSNMNSPTLFGDVTGTSVTVTGLTNGTAYFFTVQAVSSTGMVGAQSNIATATPSAPATAPTVTRSTAPLAPGSTALTIAGTGFSTIAANDTVAFNDGAVGTVTAATATSLTITFSTPPTTAGALTAVVTASSVSSGTPVQVATVTASTPQAFYAQADNRGNVDIINAATGALIRSFQPFSTPTPYRGQMSIAIGDVNGDGIPDVIVATRGNRAGKIKVFSGAELLGTGVVTASTTLFQTNPVAGYMQGLTVAAADVNGLNSASGGVVDDIVVGVRRATLDTGGTVPAEVIVLNGASASAAFSQFSRFSVFAAGYTGGVYVAAGATTAGGLASIAVSSPNESDVQVWSLANPSAAVLSNEFSPFGTSVSFTPPTGDGQISAVVTSTGVVDFSTVELVGGVVTVDTVSATGAPLGTFTTGTGVSYVAISEVNETGTGADSLGFALASGSSALSLDPLTGGAAGTPLAISLPLSGTFTIAGS
jgi:Fibronectin type III domain/FG-GAP repeat